MTKRGTCTFCNGLGRRLWRKDLDGGGMHVNGLFTCPQCDDGDARILQQLLLTPRYENETLEVTGWRMLVGCVMLNQTHRRQVDKVWPAFFMRFPTPQSVIFCGSQYMEDAYAILQPLGFGIRRTETIHRLSAWWHYERTIGFDISDAPGVGEYAEDSWKIFVLGDDTVVPKDKELRRYLGLPALQTKQETARRR